jgi:hypothetical protein
MSWQSAALGGITTYTRGDNHLNMAYELGLGTHRLEETEVVGTSIDDVRCEFEPS